MAITIEANPPDGKTPQTTLHCHPIFAEDRFANCEEAYATFAVPISIASQCLESEPSLHFYLTTFFGRNEDIGLFDKQGRSIQVYRSPRQVQTLTRDDKSAVKSRLEQLAKMVEFTVDRELKQNARVWRMHSDATAGETRYPGTNRARYRHKAETGFDGEKSKIAISGTCVDWLKEAQDLDSASPETRRRQFVMATALLHELVHAASNAQVGALGEDIFGDSLIAESGCEYSARVFGAALVGSTKNYYWAEWPSKWVYSMWTETILICRDVEKLPGGKAKCWDLTDEYIMSFFRPEFSSKASPKTMIDDEIKAAVDLCLEIKIRVCVPDTVFTVIKDQPAAKPSWAVVAKAP